MTSCKIAGFFVLCMIASTCALTEIMASDVVASEVTNSPIVVPLRKQYVPVMKNNATVAYKTSYFGQIEVGRPVPQKFTVVFDTGSGHLILPSTRCSGEACVKHNRYDMSESKTGQDIEYDGTLVPSGASTRDKVEIAFGTGKVAGDLVREVVCLGHPQRCVNVNTVMAHSMTSDPFSLFSFDGIMGIGLSPLALHEKFTFFKELVAQNAGLSSQFSVFLGSEEKEQSAIYFGGHDPRRAQSDIQWTPLVLEDSGYWIVSLTSLRIGDTVLEECEDGECRAIFDTGTSLLSVPKFMSKKLGNQLQRPVPDPDSYASYADMDCRSIPGQQIHFDFVGGGVISLDVEDYSRPMPFNLKTSDGNSELVCRPLLLPLDMPEPVGPKVFIFGEPVLRRYLSIYDLAEKQIGFALANHQILEMPSVEGMPSPERPPPESRVPGAPLRKMHRLASEGSQEQNAIASK